MIIQTGMRTDIPAFYPEWLINRIKFGSVAEMISRQFLDDTDIPVAFGFPAGHGDINYPMLMGEMTELEVGSDEFTLKFGVAD